MIEISPPLPPGQPNPWGSAATPYDQIGGEPAVRRLVESFYDHMRDSFPHIRAMHPADDLHSRTKLFEFLTGWLGGPQLYIAKHGHPRLRARHMPFPVDQRATDEWLACMGRAMDDSGITGPLRAFLESRFTHTANFMKNRE